MTAFGTDELEPLHRLRRSRQDRVVAGVAGGLAEHFDLDVGLLRVALVGLTLAGGIGVPLYLAAWILLPVDGATETVADRVAERLRTGRRHSEVPW
jgi:phage shock protein PspC (stress-responsive transcriptional regulator)